MKEKNKGQSLVEYLVLTCLIAVAAISIVSLVGRNIQEHYANISRALTKGDGKAVPLSEANPQTLKARGFQNFMENAATEGQGR